METSLHSWPRTAKEAVVLQRELAPRVETADRLDGPVQMVAGVDVAFPGGGEVTRAAVVVLAFPGFEVIETAIGEEPTVFPYVPGLLSFREVPAVLSALAKLDAGPDLLMVDGQGLAHPRRLGIACHLGLLTGLPAIGVAKSRLCGRHDEPGREKGDRTPLIHKEETVGLVLRTRTKVKPVYISVGHRVSLETAVELTLACAVRYRLPEPTRLADKLSKGAL